MPFFSLFLQFPVAARRKSPVGTTESPLACAPQAASDAFGRDPAFAQFYRSLEAYRATFRSKSDVMVMDPGSDFFRAMRGAGAAR